MSTPLTPLSRDTTLQRLPAVIRKYFKTFELDIIVKASFKEKNKTKSKMHFEDKETQKTDVCEENLVK